MRCPREALRNNAPLLLRVPLIALARSNALAVRDEFDRRFDRLVMCDQFDAAGLHYFSHSLHGSSVRKGYRA